MLFYPTAIGWHPEEKAGGEPAQQQCLGNHSAHRHAIANGCYVVAVNRCGFEPDPSVAAASSSGGRDHPSGRIDDHQADHRTLERFIGYQQ